MKKLIKRSKTKKKHKRRARSLNPQKLRQWSLAVRTRDGFKCVSCGSARNTHAHHMVSKYYRPQFAYAINNGVTLCKKCHLGQGGVHHKKSAPLNDFIQQLRLIYKLNDIGSSTKLGTSLKGKVQAKAVKKKPVVKGKKLYKRYLSKRPRSLTK